MLLTSNTERSLRKAKSRLPELFDGARQNELHARTAVWIIARPVGGNPAVVAVIAELAGLIREARHD